MSDSIFNVDAGEYVAESKLADGFKKHKEKHGGEEAVVSVFYGKNKIQKLLDADGSIGIRIYFGNDGKNVKASVTAAGNKKNLLPLDHGKSESGNYVANGPECKPNCLN